MFRFRSWGSLIPRLEPFGEGAGYEVSSSPTPRREVSQILEWVVHSVGVSNYILFIV